MSFDKQLIQDTLIEVGQYSVDDDTFDRTYAYLEFKERGRVKNVLCPGALASKLDGCVDPAHACAIYTFTVEKPVVEDYECQFIYAIGREPGPTYAERTDDARYDKEIDAAAKGKLLYRVFGIFGVFMSIGWVLMIIGILVLPASLKLTLGWFKVSRVFAQGEQMLRFKKISTSEIEAIQFV